MRSFPFVAAILVVMSGAPASAFGQEDQRPYGFPDAAEAIQLFRDGEFSSLGSYAGMKCAEQSSWHGAVQRGLWDTEVLDQQKLSSIFTMAYHLTGKCDDLEDARMWTIEHLHLVERTPLGDVAGQTLGRIWLGDPEASEGALRAYLASDAPEHTRRAAGHAALRELDRPDLQMDFLFSVIDVEGVPRGFLDLELRNQFNHHTTDLARRAAVWIRGTDQVLSESWVARRILMLLALASPEALSRDAASALVRALEAKAVRGDEGAARLLEEYRDRIIGERGLRH